MGPEVHTNTKTLAFSRYVQVHHNLNVNIKGTTLQTVQEYIYLGREVNCQLELRNPKKIERRNRRHQFKIYKHVKGTL